MIENTEYINIEKIKENIYILTTDIKEEIRKFRDEIKTAKDNLKELDTLGSRIKEIRKRLNPLENNYMVKINNLTKILMEIKDIEEAVQIYSFRQMFRAIDNNLPDGITLDDDGCDERCRKIKSRNKEIGRIEAIGEEDVDFKIQVEINGFIATTNQIENTGKIYTIINFINDRLNYKNDEITIE